MGDSRGQIIAATCELLELQGYHATGLNQIIQESGSPKGSLYYYFPGGKEELTAEALTHVGALVLERIQAQLGAADSAAEAVERFIGNIALGVEASGYRTGGPITTVALETAATSERLRATCEQIYESWRAAIEARLRADGLEAEAAHSLSTLILAAIEGGILLARTQQSPAPLQAIAHEIGDLIRLRHHGEA